MKLKITIKNNLPRLSDEQALSLVHKIVSEGKISKNGLCYCFCTTCIVTLEDGVKEDIVILCRDTKKGFIFEIVEN